MQAEEFGDISQQIERQLDQIGSGRERTISNPDQSALRPGTILVRGHAGSRYQVTVTETGIAWEGKDFRSLSVVAEAFTGTKWSGHRFFGLERQQ